MADYERLLDNVYRNLPERKGTDERFECPLADVMLQGNKSFIKNFDSLCTALRRTPAELSKWLSRELAAPVSIEGGRLCVNSKVQSRLLNEKIQEYCNASVICKECGKPDTRLESSGDRGVKVLVCEACGARQPVKK
ncbi:hypothetical protein AUJ65_00985 [Candidatus Micrarchaeota archaeon CG1_02_51_15]|nr:MAG: hypothetical protein AUJ65_00985 [Candidatus Micrarchaeota archaeon CG1_02_51_15]